MTCFQQIFDLFTYFIYLRTQAERGHEEFQGLCCALRGNVGTSLHSLP